MNSKNLIAVSTLAFLVGCGGSGNSSEPRTQPQESQASYQQFIERVTSDYNLTETFIRSLCERQISAVSACLINATGDAVIHLHSGAIIKPMTKSAQHGSVSVFGAGATYPKHVEWNIDKKTISFRLLNEDTLWSIDTNDIEPEMTVNPIVSSQLISKQATLQNVTTGFSYSIPSPSHSYSIVSSEMELAEGESITREVDYSLTPTVVDGGSLKQLLYPLKETPSQDGENYSLLKISLDTVRIQGENYSHDADFYGILIFPNLEVTHQLIDATYF